MIEQKENIRSGWFAGISFLAFIGWLIGGMVVIVPVSEGYLSSHILWVTLIFPILGLLSWFIQSGVGMKKYFVPSLVNFALSICITAGLGILFTLVSLYSFLPFKILFTFTFLHFLTHVLIWHFNRVQKESAKKMMLELYQKNKLSLDNIDPNAHIISSPDWLNKAAVHSIALGICIFGLGFLVNHAGSMNEPFSLYGLAWGGYLMTLMLTIIAARWYGHIKPAIEAQRIIEFGATEG